MFGDVVADETADVMRNWEQIKKVEKGTTSIVEGITPGLPSLLYTHKLFRKAASVGLEPGDLGEALDRIDTAVARLRAGGDDLEADLAQVLAASVVVARAGGVDAESALRGWAATYRRRFEAMERLAQSRELDLAALDPAGVAALWLEATPPPRTTGSSPSHAGGLLTGDRGVWGLVVDGGDGAHAAGVEVVDGLDDLLTGVHHERPVVGDRLADGHPAEQQHLEVLGRPFLAVGGAQRDRVTGAEHHELVVGDRPALLARVALAEHHVGERV